MGKCTCSAAEVQWRAAAVLRRAAKELLSSASGAESGESAGLLWRQLGERRKFPVHQGRVMWQKFGCAKSCVGEEEHAPPCTARYPCAAVRVPAAARNFALNESQVSSAPREQEKLG